MKPSNEDKAHWVEEYGLEKEQRFCSIVLPRFGLFGYVNPEKEHDKYALDIIVEGVMGDLKCQETPFFLSEKKSGIPAEHEFSFNRNDYERYKTTHYQAVIYIWVRWKEQTGCGVWVPAVCGLWRCPFSEIDRQVLAGAYLHTYKNRVDDTQNNAPDSYLLDRRPMERLRQVVKA